MITDKSENQYLLVTDLLQMATIGACQYEFTFSNLVVGDVNVEDGERHRAGIAYSLMGCLQKNLYHIIGFFSTYDGKMCYNLFK